MRLGTTVSTTITYAPAAWIVVEHRSRHSSAHTSTPSSSSRIHAVIAGRADGPHVNDLVTTGR